MQIAFIGLGNMGRFMARNLVRGGHTVIGHDVAAAALQELAQQGGRPASSVAECVHGADVVLTMLPAGRHVREVYTSADGVLAHCQAGALLVDSSTIDPATAREVAAQARERGAAMLDAPVSGGTGGAEAGTLTFMVGGAAEDLERARPVLQLMGKAIYHAGPSGAGQVVKMCNNMLLGIQMAGTCEALRLGIAHGLDPARLSEIMGKSSGRNWALEVYNPCPGIMPAAPASRGYTGGFSTELMLKDISLAIDAAVGSGVPTPLGAVARQIYREHKERGHGQLDFSSVFTDPVDAATLLAKLG
jgi:3-hydroxyisobutyrate dehydrogenase